MPNLKRRYSSALALTILLLSMGGNALPLAGAEQLTGRVTQVDEAEPRITLRTAEEERRLQVGRGDHAILEPGDQIRGEVVRQGADWRLQNIFPAAPEQVAVIERLGQQLTRDTLRRGFQAFRSVGERIPRFALWDQDGDLFLSEQLRGNYAVINFIFSRCAMADMCPAATLRMQQLAEALDERGWADVQLISITIDPEFDTPGVWTSYAADRGVDTSRHHFLSGPAEVIEALKKQLGVLAEPDEQQIVRHTMSTALIDPTGEIIYRIPGSRWDPRVFVRQIERHREKTEE